MQKTRLDEIRKKSLEESQSIALIEKIKAKDTISLSDVLEVLAVNITETKTSIAELIEIASEAFLSQSKNFANTKGSLSDINKKLDIIIEKANSSTAIYEAIEEYDDSECIIGDEDNAEDSGI